MSEAPKTKEKTPNKFVLPLTITGPADINRLCRELEALNEFLTQAAAKKTHATHDLPLVSHNLDNLAKQNKIDLQDRPDRDQLNQQLLRVKEQAPRLHISFATDPPAAFTEKIVNWFRSEIHPEILVQIGLEPNIAAGCILRTSNRSFDFSLKSNFTTQRPILIDKIKGGPKQPAKIEVKS